MKLASIKHLFHPLEKTESEKFDLVVSDSVMPRMIGSELCKRLKQKEETKGIPVIMIGAVEGDEAKAYDALPKCCKYKELEVH